MEIRDMELQQLGRGFWEMDAGSLTLGCKRLRPDTATFDLKSFIRPQISGLPVKIDREKEPAQVGGTRWNPTQEQIGILETLYRGGIRTPNALQIEQITAQLGKYGKIEGKNVFYWFQNHKARERQKQKRLAHHMRTNNYPLLSAFNDKGAECPNNKRKCLSLALDDQRVDQSYHNKCREDSDYNDKSCIEEEDDDDDGEEQEEESRTLRLFPLHPEAKSYLELNL